MKPPPLALQLFASLLCVVLISCSTTPSGTAGVDLAGSILMIQELPDGQVVHSWKQVEEFDLTRYKPLSRTQGVSRRVVPAASWRRDCDEENRECINKCMNRPLPRGFGHITSDGRKKGGKLEYCSEQCQQAYSDCLELEKLSPQEFTAIDDAIDWLKSNRKLLFVGGVVIIAGVVFVVVSAGGGLIILAPAVLLTAPVADSQTYMAERLP